MKKSTVKFQISISLGILLIFISLVPNCRKQAAKPAYRLLRLHYENTSGEKGVTTFGYDDRGLNHRAVWELLDGTRFSINQYSYDDQGRLQKKYREFSDGLTSTDIYEYNDEGRLVVETFTRSDGVSGTAEYEYDSTGRKTRADCKAYKGWFNGIIHYLYDVQGRLTAGKIQRQDQTIGSISYEYDSTGNMIKEVWDFQGSWSQTFGYEFERVEQPSESGFTSSNVFIRDQRSRRVEKEEYDYNRELGGPSHYSYDPLGRLDAKRFVRSDGLTTETVYIYDAQGLLLRSYRRSSNQLHTLFQYDFDEEKRLIMRRFFRSDGVEGSEVYSYDAGGRLEKGRYENMDSWLTGDLAFASDDSGRPHSAVFTGESGFDADITFEYEDHLNPVKIHWNFSNGKTQTYRFEYRVIK